jgi:tetratricopeptide (TPR) repeat protein
VDASALLQQAIDARMRQNTEAAVDAIDAAAKAAPDNPHIAAVRAQLHFETWRPSSALFDAALVLIPGDLQLLRNKALALASQGEAVEAQAILEQELARNPAWIDGHSILSKMRLTSGDGGDNDRSFAEGCARLPDHLQLRLAWFHHVAIQRDWAKVRQILAGAETQFSGQKALASAQLYVASESGDDDPAALLAAVAGVHDVGLDLCRVRLYLRTGDLANAEAVASRHIGTPSAAIFWPYLSLVWRLTGNSKAAWLDGDPAYTQVFDLDFSGAELGELAQTLRTLHILQAPYPEQSVRGGTQTDRPLFFNPDPAIQAARHKIMAAVRDYVAALPAGDAGHPLLSPPRDDLLVDGSWSVRLRDKGHHASHTHVMGWISSAFYVALPDTPGAQPSGWLGLGTPPPELGLDLPPYRTIEPKAGRLVLFPSTMWHSTFPFEAGERLTIAFDIKHPQ